MFQCHNIDYGAVKTVTGDILSGREMCAASGAKPSQLEYLVRVGAIKPAKQAPRRGMWRMYFASDVARVINAVGFLNNKHVRRSVAVEMVMVSAGTAGGCRAVWPFAVALSMARSRDGRIPKWAAQDRADRGLTQAHRRSPTNYAGWLVMLDIARGQNWMSGPCQGQR